MGDINLTYRRSSKDLKRNQDSLSHALHQNSMFDSLSVVQNNTVSIIFSKISKFYQLDYSIQPKILTHAMTGFTHFLFGVSAKHLSEEVSTTVSQKDTTGSATLISVNIHADHALND